MSDLPPADWYPDPNDDRQYRYWDGESWTEHYAPRRIGNKPRPTGELINNSVAMLRRHWRVYVAVAAVSAVIAAIVAELGTRAWIDAIDRALGGELQEILNRVTSPDFDPTTQETEDYFSSISFDPGLGALGRAALGLLLMGAAPLLGIASVARAAVADLRGRTPTTSDALVGGLGRLGRLFGVVLQIWAAFAVVGIVVAVSAFLSILLTIPLGLAALVLGVASFPVLGLAGTTAAIGPKKPSLRYTFSLVKAAYWPAFGRLLVITLLAVVVVLAISMPFALISPRGELIPTGGWLIVSMVGDALVTAVALTATIPSVLVYRDLGGEIAPDP